VLNAFGWALGLVLLMQPIAAYADVTIAWNYAGTSYSTQQQAVAAMQAATAQNAVLTVQSGITSMSSGATTYQYVAPNQTPSSTTQYWGNGIAGWESSESAAATDAEYPVLSANAGICGSVSASPTGSWTYQSYISYPVYGAGYYRNYVLNYWGYSQTGDVCFTEQANTQLYSQALVSCPSYYSLSGSTCVDSHTDSISSTPLTCPCVVAPGASALKGDPVDAASGEYTEVQEDYSGPILSFHRYYHSGTLESFHGLGVGWTHQYAAQVILNGGSPDGLLRPDGYHDPLTWANEDGWVDEPYSGDGIHLRITSGGFTAYLPDGSQELYNSSGALVELVSPAGLVTTLSYTGGYLVSVNGPFGQALSFSYNSENQISTVTDPAGATIVYAYDGSGNLSSVTYQDGTSRTYQYENTSFPNNLTGIVDESGGQFNTVSYDSVGRAVSAQNAGGANAISVSYATTSATVSDALSGSTVLDFTDASGYSPRVSSVSHNGLTRSFTIPSPSTDFQQRATQLTDENGNVTTYSYDSDHLTSMTQASGTTSARTTSFDYLSTDGAVPTLITEPLRTISYSYYSGTNNVETKTITDTSVTPNVSRTWTYTYDSYGRVLTLQGPRTDLTRTTTYTYYTCTTGSQCGQVQTITDAVGNVTTYNTYNAHGQPLTITDPNGTVTTLTYDARQRLTSREVGTESTGFAYYSTGLLETVTLPDSSTIQYSYDGAHRLTGIADSAGNSIAYTLDAMGNRTAEKSYDPSSTLHRTHSRVYNSLNELYQDINAAGTSAVTTSYSYDSYGNQTGISAPLSRTTSKAYDALNRLNQITDPASGVTQFSYDANDNLTSVTDPRSLTTSYTYNGFGDVTQLVSPDTGTTTNTYDSGGNLSVSTDARSDSAHYSYDALNRVSGIIYKNGSGVTDQTLAFTYDTGTDGKGRLASAADGNQSLSWAYDGHGRVTGKGQTIGTLTLSVGYGYTNADLTAISTPSGQAIVYSYNSNHQVTGITVNGATLLSSVTYEPFGGVNGWSWGSGDTVSRTYNGDGLISQIVSASVTNGYSFDNASRITGISDSSNSALSWSYGYDALDRLTSATTSAITDGWTYDANGNRLSQTGTNAITFYIPSDTNQLSSTTGSLVRSYVYNAAGMTTTYGSDTFAYNNRGRMLGVSVGSTSTSYLYNALGQLIEKAASSPTNLYVYDEAGHLLGEYDGSGNLIEETVWLGDIPVATLQPNGSGVSINYVHSNQLNSPTKITRSSDNTLEWRIDQDPFGTAAPNQNPGSLGTFVYNLRFPGQLYMAETGLNYNYRRDYDPQVGRYVESDPVGVRGGINTYSYTRENPVMYVDPRGLCDSSHSYSYSAQSACAAATLFALVELPGNSAPGSPAATEGTTNNIMLPGGNPITQVVNSQTMTIINITQPGHRYDPGTVTIQVTPEPDGTSVISVVGEGTGPHPIENDVVGLLWFGWDIQNLAKYCVPSIGLVPGL
jgi:RHS repeat-associated protein